MKTAKIICLLVSLGFSCTLAQTGCQTLSGPPSSVCKCDGDTIISCNTLTMDTIQTLGIFGLKAKKIAANFQVQGNFEAISIQECLYLEPKSIGPLISKYGGTLQRLVLKSLFAQVALSEGPLDLSGYASPAFLMQLNELSNMQVQLPKVLLLDKNKAFPFQISDAAVSNSEVNLVINEPASPDLSLGIEWGGQNVLPNIYKRKNGKEYYQQYPLQIKFDQGAQFILKETLYYYPQLVLRHVGEVVQRIEYGTLTYGDKVKAENFMSSHDIKSFEEGKCLEQYQGEDFMIMCVICYMHQYQLHRTNDNLESKCLNKQKVTSSMKKCYWRSLVAPSKTVTDKYEVVIPPVATVKVCDDLPQDIKDYLAAPNPHDPDNDQEDNGNKTTSGASAIVDDACVFWLWTLVSLGYINV